MKFQIREAEIKDSVLITALSNQLGYNIINENTRSNLFEILKNKDNCVFVAVDNENIIGWIHAFYSIRLESSPFIEIGGMVVEESYRRNGLGKILVEKVIEWSVLKNCNKVRVRCNILRTDTHEFYKDIGFSEIKKQKIYEKAL